MILVIVIGSTLGSIAFLAKGVLCSVSKFLVISPMKGLGVLFLSLARADRLFTCLVAGRGGSSLSPDF